MSDLDELSRWSATRLAGAIRRREVSAREAVDAALAAIEERNPPVNAFVTVVGEQAREHAEEADRRSMRREPDELGALHGVPISVKDLTPTAGVRTTYGSRHYRDHVPTDDALAWSRVKAAGAVLIGKTTTPEFGWLGVTDSPLTGVTNNPWDLQRTSGGSSGGAAVATALSMGAAALGSDGAGSLRIPASFCGVVGLKASAGRIPIHGEDSIYATTEAMGPLTRTVEDAALLLGVMSGPDEREAYPLPPLSDPVAALRDDVAPATRVAVVRTLAGMAVEPDVAAAVDRAAALLGDHLIVEDGALQLPDPVDHMLRYWRPAMTMLMDELVAQGMDLPDSHPVLIELAEQGRAMTAVELWQAAIVDRGVLHQGVAEAFSHADVLVMPTAPLTAFPHPGPEGGPSMIAGSPAAHPFASFLVFTAPFNMTGHPALSIPAGFDSQGLPIGVQVVGGHGCDLEVLRVGLLLERLLSDANQPSQRLKEVV